MKVAQNKDIAWQEYDGEVVLVDPEDAVCRVLNETASFIWKQCGQPCSAEKIVEGLYQHYHVTRDELQEDVDSIMKEFLAKRILEEVG